MTEREIAITVIVVLSAISILTTPFMLIKRDSARLRTSQRPLWQKALLWTSNIALVVLLGWLGFYLWHAMH